MSNQIDDGDFSWDPHLRPGYRPKWRNNDDTTMSAEEKRIRKAAELAVLLTVILVIGAFTLGLVIGHWSAI